MHLTMSDLAERLYNLIKAEIAMHKEEEAFRKTIIKYTQAHNKTEDALKNEIIKKCSEQQELNYLERENIELEKCFQEAEAKRKNYDDLQTEYETLTTQLEDEEMLNCIKKECTNIFLNPQALPGAAQGMSVCEDRFIPFNVAINSINMSEVSLEIWDRIQNLNDNREQWEELILDNISND